MQTQVGIIYIKYINLYCWRYFVFSWKKMTCIHSIQKTPFFKKLTYIKYFLFETLNRISLSMWQFNEPLLTHSDEHWIDILLDLFDSLKNFEDFAVKKIKTFYCDERKTFRYCQCGFFFHFLHSMRIWEISTLLSVQQEKKKVSDLDL